MRKIVAGMLVALALAWAGSAARADQIDDYYNYQVQLIHRQARLQIDMLGVEARRRAQNGNALQASLWLQQQTELVTEQALRNLRYWQAWRLRMKRQAAGG